MCKIIGNGYKSWNVSLSWWLISTGNQRLCPEMPNISQCWKLVTPQGLVGLFGTVLHRKNVLYLYMQHQLHVGKLTNDETNFIEGLLKVIQRNTCNIFDILCKVSRTEQSSMCLQYISASSTWFELEEALGYLTVDTETGFNNIIQQLCIV